MLASEALNWLWAGVSLAGAAWVGWSCLPGRGRRPGRRDVRTRLVAVAVLAGFLFPAISASDDTAIWRQQIEKAIAAHTHPAAPEARGRGKWKAPHDASANFWLLFNHLSAAPAQATPRAALSLARGEATAPPPPVFSPRRSRSRAPPLDFARRTV